MHDLHVFSLLMSKLEEMRDVWESRFNGLERLHKRKRTEKSPLKATSASPPNTSGDATWPGK